MPSINLDTNINSSTKQILIQLTTKNNEKETSLVQHIEQQKCKNQHRKNVSKSYKETLSTSSKIPKIILQEYSENQL